MDFTLYDDADIIISTENGNERRYSVIGQKFHSSESFSIMINTLVSGIESTLMIQQIKINNISSKGKIMHSLDGIFVSMNHIQKDDYSQKYDESYIFIPTGNGFRIYSSNVQ